MEYASWIFYLLGGIFLVGYILIALEHNTKINKSGVAIVMGSILWILVDIFNGFKHEVGLALSHETQEIFAIVVFLLAAMTIVEVLVHYKFFDWIQDKITQKKLSSGTLFFLLGALTFIMSAFLDNLTTTLIMVQIGRKVYKDNNNYLIFMANTIIAANAGGVASPIGDVTTIMLWLANKFTAGQVISIGILPSLASWLVPQFMMARKITKHEEVEKAHNIELSEEEKGFKPFWSVILVGLFSFTLPVIFNLIGLPPFLGLLTGVGVLWILIDFYNKKHGGEHHKEGQIIKIVQKVDLSTLKFFIGILLAVGALSHVGILRMLNDAIFGVDLNVWRMIFGNVTLGGISSVLDNVPLVAAAIKMFSTQVPVSMWVLLAITAGTGGSMLVIGSAAGVAAMGQVKGLTFGYYLKKATIPALMGYLAGVGVWILMYFFIF